MPNYQGLSSISVMYGSAQWNSKSVGFEYKIGIFDGNIVGFEGKRSKM